MAENVDRLQLEFNDGDLASVAIALKRVSEHLAARISALEIEVACLRRIETGMMLLEENHEFKLLARVLSRRQIHEIVSTHVRAQLDAGGDVPLDQSFLMREMAATHLRLATSDGELVDPPQTIAERQ